VTALEASALARHDRLWPVVLASALVHVALGGWALMHRSGLEVDPGQKPIVAKLVRLGEKRPENLLPRKEEEAPPAAPTPKTAPVAPAPTAKAAPVLDAKAKAKPAATTPPEGGGQPGGDPLARVMSKLQKEKAEEAPRWGDPSGDAEGDASEGSEGDRYLALVQRAIRSNFRLPATIPERERLHLRATVILLLEPTGAIRDFKIVRRSGNAEFDDAVERSARWGRLPPPPPSLAERYRRDGIQVEYTAP
jgi:colicin import membrane protein/protein TonB